MKTAVGRRGAFKEPAAANDRWMRKRKQNAVFRSANRWILSLRCSKNDCWVLFRESSPDSGAV